MSPLKVLHVIYDHPDNPWVGGGGALRAFEIYRRLAGRIDVEIASGRFPGSRDGARDGVRYRFFGAPGPYALSRLSYAAEANRLLRCAVYDAAIFDLSVYTPVFAPRDRPVGVTVHHVTGRRLEERWGRRLGTGMRTLERTMIRRARRLAATSHATVDAIAALGEPGSPIDVVGAGVSDELFSIVRSERDYVLYVGRLDVEHKGLDTLVRAFRDVAELRPWLRLVIAGRGRDEARVRAMVAEEGLGARVTIAGPVSDGERNALFAGALVQIMPSRFEGFGMVAAEALAAGVPLVATSVGSLPEVVRGAALLVPPDDPDALAAAMSRLLDDEGERARAATHGREVARSHDWSVVADAHAAFVERVATEGGQPR